MARKVTPLLESLRFRDFRLLWFAQVLSELGDWAARVALAVVVYDRTGSSTLTAAVVAVSFAPWLGLGQALAAYCERFPHRNVMVATDAVRGVFFMGIAFSDQPWVMLTLAFLAAAATPPFEAARAAVLPDVVEESRYGDALTLSNITYQAVLVLGYLAGGGLVAGLGAREALVVNASSFLLSAGLIAGMKEGRAGRTSQTIRANLGRAVRTIIDDTYLRRAVIVTTVGSSAAIVGEALVAVYVREHLHSGSASIGLLAAMVPIGTIVASALVPRKGEIPSLLRASASLIAIGGGGAFIGFMIAPGVVGSALSYVSLGVVFAVLIPAYSFVGLRLPADIRASAFAVLQGTLLGGQALGTILGGVLAATVGAPRATAFALLPALGVAAFALIVSPHPSPSPAGSTG